MTKKKSLKKKAGKITTKTKQKTVENLEEYFVVDEEEKSKKGMGRPIIMTPRTIQKVKLCFAVGMTDLQACYFSGISKSKLYEYQKEFPDFLEEKEILKESITLQARLNIGSNIKKGDTSDSKWWLTLRDKDFMNKLNIIGLGKPILDLEDQKRYTKILDNNI